VAATEQEPEPAAGELPLVGSLDANRYYLQVGAYSNAGSAQRAVAQLGAQYPTEVLADGGEGRTLYRVLVGPLNEDERGSVLYFVRAMGYRDAFIRQAGG
jgi:cell division protein FtsN